MTRKPWLFSAFVLALALPMAAQTASAQDAKTVIQNAQQAMGKANSIQYSGTGTAGGIGQNWNPTSTWHQTVITSYTRTIDYVNGASKEEITRTQENPPAKGGEAPFGGEQKQTNFVGGGGWAWNAPPPNQPDLPIGAAPGGVGVPQPAASEERALQILLTPHGFLRAAAEGKATVSQGKDGGKNVTMVTFMDDNGHKIVGDIDDQNMVTKVDSWLPNAVLGDMLVETTYTDYKDFGGVKFPSHIVQKEGGWPVLDLTVTSAKANVPAFIQVAGNAIGETAPPVNVVAQKMADGVWFLGGGTHNSVLVEFKDYVAVVEAPLNDARSQGVMDEVKMLVPNKPIKYLINTHHHFDHSGGLRAYVAAGATIITQEGNKSFYETAWKAPRTLQPDMLSQNPKPATFITFKDKYVLTDGTRSLDMYKLQGDNHNELMSVAYLPKEKILIEADDFTPGPPNAPAPPPVAMGFANNLYDNLQRLKLSVDMIAPLHGNPVPMAAMLKVLGKTESAELSCN